MCTTEAGKYCCEIAGHKKEKFGHSNFSFFGKRCREITPFDEMLRKVRFRGVLAVDMVKKRLLVVVALLLVIMGGSGYAYYQKNSVPESVSSEVVLSSSQADKPTEATVYISGAVMQPGVIKVPNGTRVIDVVDLAGGLATGADVSKLNLAQPVKDGMHIKVPGEIPRNSVHSNSEKPAGDKVNINTASKSELDTLPGIGPSLAQKIIDYRETNGTFHDISDLKRVSGITEKRFNKIKDKITI